VINDQLYKNVSEYLYGFGKDKNYQLVLTFTRGSGVLYADQAMDITDQVIEGLNNRFREEQAAELANDSIPQ